MLASVVAAVVALVVLLYRWHLFERSRPPDPPEPE